MIKSHVRHEVPGRIRFDLDDLVRGPVESQWLESQVKSLPAVLTALVNLRTQSLLIIHRGDRSMRRAIENLLSGLDLAMARSEALVEARERATSFEELARRRDELIRTGFGLFLRPLLPPPWKTTLSILQLLGTASRQDPIRRGNNALVLVTSYLVGKDSSTARLLMFTNHILDYAAVRAKHLSRGRTRPVHASTGSPDRMPAEGEMLLDAAE